jgi:rfaE bifunctional protein nucleotidyltransferase chain/domain
MKIVLCHGVFDLFHYGHLLYLSYARGLGDKLRVSVTADRYVNKGPGRPVFNQGQRMEMLWALRFVDRVILSDAPTPEQVIREVRPNIYVKHVEYRGKLPEQALVEELGGRVVFAETPKFSSTELMGRLK